MINHDDDDDFGLDSGLGLGPKFYFGMSWGSAPEYISLSVSNNGIS